MVAVRSTWDYSPRLEAFLAWARSVGPALINGADCFAWNTDKSYLVALGEAGVPIVPTQVVEGEESLPAAVAAHDASVLKPTVGAGGRGVVVFDLVEGGPAALDEALLGPGPWVVQPLVESVRTEGEHSVFVLGGEAVAQVCKRPAGTEIRVHPRYGGVSAPVPLDPAAGRAGPAYGRGQRSRSSAATLSLRARGPAASGRRVVGRGRAGGDVEPGLYLEELPDNAHRFAGAAGRWLSG